MTYSTHLTHPRASRLISASLALTAMGTLPGIAGAQPYTVNWSTTDGGGATFPQGPGFTYTVGCTSGQHDAGPAPIGPAAGGPYTVAGGFWLGAPVCLVDWDGNGIVNSTDVGEFINDWFEDQVFGTLVTDWDNNGIVNSTDVGEFINAWFVGCPAV